MKALKQNSLPRLFPLRKLYRFVGAENRNKLSPKAIFLLMSFYFLIIFPFIFNHDVRTVHAESKFQTNEIYDPTAMMITLRTISMAAETYAVEKGVYPSKISDLTEANPPYLGHEYCQETVWGYSYGCSFSETDYVITAVPLEISPKDALVLTIKTQGILETQLKSGGDKTEPDFSFSPKDFWSLSQIDKYKRFLQQDPENNQLRLILANLYAGSGDGDTAVSLAQQVISSQPDEVLLQKAYHTAVLGYYLQGDLDQGYKILKEMLHLYPHNSTALSFKKLFETLIEKKAAATALPWEAVLVEEIIAKTAETTDGLEKNGIGGISLKPGEEDFILLDFGKIFFTSPPGWYKGANIHSVHGDSLIFYTKDQEAMIPSISITVDTPEKKVKSALEFAIGVKSLIQQQFPFLEFADPQEKTIGGRLGSYDEMKVQSNQDRSAWYQFLISGRIITIQYSNTEDQFSSDYHTFEAIVTSMKLENEDKKN